ncbi:amino acid adenylation domain-containing protein [Marinivivus vitaminiproducens]|uniref:amino acid adenylation domain-containing protein n=1 Tax=Marinivivus vitaminiproducens TaxID=3035935 RepID=UPI00279BE5C4|nr:amino acid adenylation domain-containing protein [Geminicoccaceae bacterium SCSIO 64248]
MDVLDVHSRKPGMGFAVRAVAVNGMACRLPGAESYAQFWRNLTKSKEFIKEIPRDRWNLSKYYSPDRHTKNTSNSKWGGLIDDVDRFDHGFFGLSAREARSMDPQQRLLLQEAWHCIEDAGIRPETLRQAVTAAYVGVMTIDYHQNVTAPDVDVDSYACLGNYAGILANRLSNSFGWRGESFALDAACAGSLTALHQARKALLAGECDYALVAGVSLILNPWHYVSFSKARMLSPNGRCRSFDRDADGYVPGEGVCVLLLCREEDALREGRRVHGRLLGTATGHVGVSASITAPSVDAQRRVIEGAAAAAGVGLDTVSYIEAHGTGTALGDPIEVAALREALAGAGPRAAACRIGSVKTNIGHLEAAAGLAGIIKVLLMMRERTLVPTLNLERHNPLIDFGDGHLSPVEACEPWDASVLRAGVSAFGFGGTNAHAILEAPPETEPATTGEHGAPLPFTLSARSPGAFRALWLAWRAYADSPAFDRDRFTDVLATQACGRAALDYRWSAVPRDKVALRRLLAQEPPEPSHRSGKPSLSLHVGDAADAIGTVSVLRRAGVRPDVIEADANLWAGLEKGARGGVAFFDREHRRLHLPWALDAAYLDALRDALTLPHDAETVIQRARELAGSNFTFRAYLDDWQRALGHRGDMRSWLAEPPDDATLRRLFLLGCVTCHRRLVQRWKLPAPRDPLPEAWVELARLVADGLVVDTEAVAFVCSEIASDALAPVAASRALGAVLEHYPVLSRHSGEREGVVSIDEPSVDLVVAPDGREPEALLASLWQAGVDVDWAALRPSFRTVSLPLYPFERHRHWIAREPESPALSDAGAELAVAPVPPPAPPAESTLDRLDRYAAYLAFIALDRTGVLTALGIGLSREEIASRCLRLPRYRPLLHAVVDILDRHGLTAVEHGHVRALATRREVAAMASALRSELDADVDEGAVLGRIVDGCVSSLPAVLAGDTVAEDVLFPAGDMSQVECLLSGHGEARRSMDLMAAAVADEVSARGDAGTAGPVRILEVGGGTGLATQSALAALGSLSASVDYVCTDRSQALLAAGRERLAGRSDGVRFERFDCDAPAEPSDPLGTFDVVLAANTLHALPHVTRGLQNLRSRLRPSGALILNEPSRSRDALTLTLGLLSDWWRTDPARDRPGALISTRRWEDLLRQAFCDVDVLTSEERSVIVARTPGARSDGAEPGTDLLSVIREAVAEVVEANADAVDPDARFADLGVDSLAVDDLARLLSDRFGKPVAPQTIDDHATPIRLARHLAARQPDAVPPGVSAAPEPAVAEARTDDAGLMVAILDVVASVTEGDRATIDERRRFVDLGIDSLAADDLARLLGQHIGRAIPPQFVDEHPTPLRLARYLAGLKADAPTPEAGRSASPSARPSDAKRPERHPLSHAETTTQAWDVTEPGNLDSLTSRDVPRREPGPGEVEVEVVAAGLNFRDVMEGLGRLGHGHQPLGLEFAGRITACGAGVAGMAPGDEVVGLKVGSLARHVVTRARLVARKPAHLSFAEAACLPIVCLTAAWTLEQIARLGPGMTVLVHAASGGVGLAALQIARAAGATVLGTAGNAAKRTYLNSLGVSCVGDSRSTAFAEQVRDATGGAGVDVVLNCLTGAMTDASLALVRKGGVFIEIGKTDIRPEAEIARRYPGVRYRVFDLLAELDTQPLQVGDALADLLARFDAGELDPLPVRGFTFAEAASALRFLARAKHIGKVAITHESGQAALPPAEPEEVAAPVSEGPAPIAAAPAPADAAEPIAIVGMAGCFPGAPDLGSFWSLLSEARDAIGEVPAGRWHASEFTAAGVADMGEARHRAGGFLADAECFDAALFGISPREALLMDPQQRVLLEQTWLALADAGWSRAGDAGARTGVFVGASASDYGHKTALLGMPPDRPSLLAQMPSSLSARIGYVFDLKGPSLTVDMGCASAVAAIKLAADALRRGEVDAAIAAAVAVQSTPHLALMADRAEILSPDGRCRSFSRDADGLGLSEGAGVIVLKRLSDALASEDTIHGVIRAAVVSQNGATNGMTAPSVSTQVGQARAAFDQAGLSPDSVSYVEGHGVGTKAGDAAEVAALATVFGSGRRLPVGSVKSNVGHCLAAAGMASLLKVLLQFRFGRIVPSLHARGAAARALAEAGLSVVDELTPWQAPDATPRRAAINTFAINGSNGFMLVEQAPRRTVSAKAAVPPCGALFLFAARDEEALRARLKDLAGSLGNDAPDLADLACTFATAVTDFRARAAFVANDRATLVRQLRSAADGDGIDGGSIGRSGRRDPETRGVFSAMAVQLCDDAAIAEPAAGRAKLLAAARLFVDGVDFAAPVPSGARRLSLLPSHRFERQRYWPGDAVPVVHPASPGADVPALPVSQEPDVSGQGRRSALLKREAAAVLGMPEAAVTDAAVLTRLGLDSLMAFELKGRLSRVLGVAIDTAGLLSERPIADLVRALPEETAHRAPIESVPAERHEPFPLTDIQLAYWLGRTSDFALGGACHVYWEFEQPGERDVDRLEASFNRLIDLHDMLRAVVQSDGQQRVLPSVPRYRIERHAWSAGDGADRLAALRDTMAQERFEPTQWPLFRIAESSDGLVSRVHFSIDLLIVDVPSIALLLQQWARLYRDPAAKLTPPKFTFRDYVLHMKRQERTHAYEAARSYWRARMQELPPAPRLHGMKPLDVRSSWSWKRHHAALDAATWSTLRDRAREKGATPVAMLVAAFAEALAHVAVDRRFSINLTVNDRQSEHPDIGTIVGDFTSTVLLGLDLERPLAFAARACSAGQELAAHLGHAAFSGVRVLQERGGSGEDALMPVVFTSMLGYGALSGPLGRLTHGATQTPQVWLDAQVMEDQGGLVVTWDAIDALFPDGLVGGAFATWVEALRGLAADRSLWDRPLGGWLRDREAERRARRNATGHPMVDELLHEGFVREALSHPERTAIVACDRTLSYGDLLARAAAVAAAIGPVEPNRLVAVAAPKGWQQIAAAIGVLMAGSAYLPIDPDLPQERRRHLITRGEVRIVLAVTGTAGGWPDEVRVVDVDQLAPGPLASAMPPRRAAPTDLAYVIFTSGSTGEPKGVMIEHRAALNTVLDCNERYAVGPGDRVLGLSALGFDLSVYDIFGLLGAGGAVVLPSARSAGDPAHLAELIRRHGVTIWNSVPMFAELFLKGGPEASAALQGVRLVMMSGDWIPVDLPDRLRAANPAIEIISMGGATEASIWSIAYRIGERDPAWTSVPYGYPMRNQSFHVLDERMEPCPDWVAGELYIGGAGLARGYWRDPATTDARFIVHPSSGERLYRTGDLGRYRDDGIIEFLGRADGQVKVGGYRIELGEIEAALVRHPAVRQAAVVVQTDDTGHRSLVAFYVAHARASPEPDAIHAHLAAILPAYMVPASFHRLDALPLNANEKVDRKALAARTERAPSEREVIRVASVVPSAAALDAHRLEADILAIWRDVLVDPKLPADGKLFEHGAHSFHAVEANARINRALPVACTVTDIFEFVTVRALAAALASRHGSGSADAETNPDDPVNGHEVPPPFVRGQRRRQFRASLTA